MPKKTLFLSCLIVILPLAASFFIFSTVRAQEALPAVCTNPATEDVRQNCEQLQALNTEISQYQGQLKQQQTQTGTIKKDVTLLTTQIATAKLKIQQKTITINNLTHEITAKAGAIVDLQGEIGREHDSLAQLIKKTNELDQKGAAYVVLSAQSVTDFYQDLDDFLAVKQSLYASVNHIKQIKSTTEDQKQSLEDKQAQEKDAKNAIDAQKKIVEQSEAQKKELLRLSQGKEAEYQGVLADRQKKVAAIKSKLFQFAGGSKAIPFGDAYTFATAASTATGVRSAFILAILTQESNLGKNVGTCNRPGDPVSKSWINIMSPTRDQAAFKRITAALGLDPNTTPVSCPIAGGGWGGAMGPSQFIPSTWEIIQARVATALGKGAANPWNPQDAIMATAIYLKDRGGIGSEANERNAACRYYSGRACDGKKPANSFYGNNVMALARTVQADIDYLVQYGVSRR